MATSTKQNTMTFATLAGNEPVQFEVPFEAIFTDPRDDAFIPQQEDITPVLQNKRRFPSLAALRAKKASLVSEHAVRAEHARHADDECRHKTCCGPISRKEGMEGAAITSALKQEVQVAATRGTHLAGAAVLGLRKHTHAADDSSAQLKNTLHIPCRMMGTVLSEVASSTKVPKAVKAPTAPRPQLAAGNRRRPIPSNVQVLIVPGIC